MALYRATFLIDIIAIPENCPEHYLCVHNGQHVEISIEEFESSAFKQMFKLVKPVRESKNV